MFSLLFYKVMHLVGLFLAFMGLAGLVWAAATGADKASKRPALIFHGVGLFFALVGVWSRRSPWTGHRFAGPGSTRR